MSLSGGDSDIQPTPAPCGCPNPFQLETIGSAHKQTLNPDGLRFPHRKIAGYAMLLIALNNRKPPAIEASDLYDHTALTRSNQSPFDYCF